MGEKRVGWEPHPGPQRRFLASSAFEALYGGARGGGKSDCLLYGGLRQVHHPKYRALVIRRTYPELTELIDRSHEMFPQLGGHWVASEKRWVFPSGCTYEFGYCETLKEVQQYRGQQFTYVGFDEIGLIPDPRVWLTLLTSIRHTSDGLIKMARASANPGGPGHGWVRKRFIVPCPPDGTPIYDEQGNTRSFFQARVYDNPSILEKDPDYVKMLESLPGTMRLQELEGDWTAGTGLAFEELNQSLHFIPYRQPEPWEGVFAAFDWGYSHNFSAGLYVTTPEGIVKVDTVTGRRLVPHDIVARVKERFREHGVEFSRLQYTVAGSDVKQQEMARGNSGPSIFEQFLNEGWVLINADQGRSSGYSNMLHYLHHGPKMRPLFRFMDTPGNRACFDQLESMVVDPDSPNEVRKVNADPLTGEGGDDMYDETRYALMSRPMVQRKPNRLTDRINQERLFAKPQTEQELSVPWASRMPSPTNRNDRIEKVV